MKPKTDSSIEYRDVALEFRVDESTGAPVVEGYAAVFDSLSDELFEWGTGKFREKIVKGAFARTIKNQNIPLLVEHRDLPLATTKARTLELTEDSHGLHFRSTLDGDDPDVKRLVPKMRRGDMSKCSFGFYPVQEDWDFNAKPRIRTLKEVRLFDVSIVANPAYPATEAKVRALLLDDGLDAESIADLFVRVKQGSPLDDDDRGLMRRLVDTCTPYLVTTTDSQDADSHLSEHSAQDSHPVTEPTSGPQPPLHPLSWYREQLKRLEVTA